MKYWVVYSYILLAFINTTSIVSDEVSTLAAYSDVKRYPNGLDAKCLDRPIQLYLEPSESSGRKSLQDRLRMWEFSWWLSLEFSVLSYSIVQPFISIFGLFLTQCLCHNIQSFYWACPFDSGSRRRANRLEKRSLSRLRHISLHHSQSSERRTVIPLRFLWTIFFSAFWILRAPNLPPTPSQRGVRYKSACHPRWH